MFKVNAEPYLKRREQKLFQTIACYILISLSNLAETMIILMPMIKFHAIRIASRNALALVHFMHSLTAADRLFVNLCDNKAVSEVARVTTDGESDPGETGGVLLGLGSCPITPQS